MKVKDLEPVLQEMLKRILPFPSETITDEFYNRIDWIKCNNEERLAECRRRYKEGLVINCLHSVHKNWVVPNSFKIWGEEGIIRIWSNYGTGVCCLYYDGKFAEIVTDEKAMTDFEMANGFHSPKDEPIETKEQIRTELINELIEWNNEEKFFEQMKLTIDNKLQSMLPTETPEKIAERKAEGMMSKSQWHTQSTFAKDIKQMLIEALLTDIKK